MNFILACFVFKYSLNFSRWWGDKEGFTTTVYHKPTFSGVYSNFNGFIADEYKHG